MVSKNLKVGDTFEDGKRYFRVVKVYEDGTYSSMQIEKPLETAQKPHREPKTEEPIIDTATEIEVPKRARRTRK